MNRTFPVGGDPGPEREMKILYACAHNALVGKNRQRRLRCTDSTSLKLIQNLRPIILGVHDYGIMSLSSSSSTVAVIASTTAVPMVHRRCGKAASLGSTQSAKSLRGTEQGGGHI